jgi:hypothetical protein
MYRVLISAAAFALGCPRVWPSPRPPAPRRSKNATARSVSVSHHQTMWYAWRRETSERLSGARTSRNRIQSIARRGRCPLPPTVLGGRHTYPALCKPNIYTRAATGHPAAASAYDGRGSRAAVQPHCTTYEWLLRCRIRLLSRRCDGGPLDGWCTQLIYTHTFGYMQPELTSAEWIAI